MYSNVRNSMGGCKISKINNIPPHTINIGGYKATYESKKNQLIIVQLPSFLNHIILRSKEVDSFNPHLPTSILTDFSVCQLEKLIVWGGRNSMGGVRVFEKNLIYPP